LAALPVGSIFVKVREGDAGARDALYENSFTRLRLIDASLLSRSIGGQVAFFPQPVSALEPD